MVRPFYFIILVILLLSGMIFAGACSSTTATTTPTASQGNQVKPSEPGANPGPDYQPGAITDVIIENYAYSPATLTVATGTTVTWTNRDSVRHTVTTRTSLFDSGLFGKDQSFSYTFDQKGEYEYYCIPHPYMIGKVIVE